MVGIAQLVSASDCGSEGRGFESHYPPHFYTGLSPSGKAQDFDSCIPMVRIHLAQPFCLANTGVSPRGKASDSGSDIPRVQILPPQPNGFEPQQIRALTLVGVRILFVPRWNRDDFCRSTTWSGFRSKSLSCLSGVHFAIKRDIIFGESAWSGNRAVPLTKSGK